MAWQFPISVSKTDGTIAVDLGATDNVIVAAGILAASTGTALRGTGQGHEIRVAGSVLGGIAGIDLAGFPNSANSYRIKIDAGGLVFADIQTAISLAGAGTTLTNAGEIDSNNIGVFLSTSIIAGVTDISNSGIIRGDSFAIARSAATADLAINLVNTGLIQGATAFGDYGAVSAEGNDKITNIGRMIGNILLEGGDDVYAGSSGRLTGTVFGGDGKDTISGGVDNDIFKGGAGNDALSGGAGNDLLDGGTGADKMTGGTGNDTYVLNNAGDVVTEATGGGTDLVQSSISWTMAANVEKVSLTGSAHINATGNSLSNTITGNAGNNALNGGAGNDTINGGARNDKLYGGNGNDTLTGGSGVDSFVFSTAPNSSTNRDTITDFNVQYDTISLDNAIFTTVGANGGLSSAAFHIGTAAADANDRIIYNASTGALTYDSNGSASGGAVQFAKLAAGLALTNADFFII